MDSYAWQIKEWKFNANNIEEKKAEMMKWIAKWEHKYQIRQVFTNNAWAVEYKMKIRM